MISRGYYSTSVNLRALQDTYAAPRLPYRPFMFRQQLCCFNIEATASGNMGNGRKIACITEDEQSVLYPCCLDTNVIICITYDIDYDTALQPLEGGCPSDII